MALGFGEELISCNLGFSPRADTLKETPAWLGPDLDIVPPITRVLGEGRSTELNQKCEKFLEKVDSNSTLLKTVITDLRSPELALRLGSCNLLGKLLNHSTGRQLHLTSCQYLDAIKSLVLSLTNASSGKEATLTLWTLKRDALLSREEMKSNVVTLLYACQKAASDIKSESASRPSYAVAVAILQLISRLYVRQKDIMENNTRIWFSLTLSYCCHGVSKLLRSRSQEIVELAYQHLLENAAESVSIVSDVSENVIANITNILHKQYNEECKLFAIKLWGLLVTIMGKEMECEHSTNLYLSALRRAFSKNYPSRQMAAFHVWKLLINNFTVEYLLRPDIRKRLCIPLTQSNRVEQRKCLLARVAAWWALIRKIGGCITEHFTEICSPLLEFCQHQQLSANSTTRPLSNLGLRVIRTPAGSGNPLEEEQLAILLQYLGQRQTCVLPSLRLGENQRVDLTLPIIQQCGKVLLQSLRECIDYVYLMTEERREGYLPSLLRAYSTLVKSVADNLHLIKSDDIVKTLARQVFSIILNSSVTGVYALDLVSPATHFDSLILRSTAYTPTEVRCYSIKTPATLMVQKLGKSCSELSDADDINRFCELMCQVIEKGCAMHTNDHMALALAVTPITVCPELLLRPLCHLASLFGQFLEKADEIGEQLHYSSLCAVKEMIQTCPAQSSSRLLHSLGMGLVRLAEAQPITDVPEVKEFLCKVATQINNSDETEMATMRKVLPLMNHVLKDLSPSVRQHWCLADTKTQGELSKQETVEDIAVEEGEELKETGQGALVSATTSKVQNPSPQGSLKKSPTKKRLVLRSMSNSPLRASNRKRLVLQDSPVSAGNSGKKKCPNTPEGDSESYGLLNGLLTPDKRQKLTERTPQKSGETSAPLLKLTDTPTKRGKTKSRRLSKKSTESSADELTKEERLVTPPVQASQCIENSPDPSQTISQYVEAPDCQGIPEQEKGSEVDTLTHLASPLPTKLHRYIAQTPGMPVTSPVHESETKNSLSPEPTTPLPLAFTSPTNDLSPPVDSLPLCSVKITRSKLTGITKSCTSISISESQSSDKNRRSSRTQMPKRKSHSGKSKENSQKVDINCDSQGSEHSMGSQSSTNLSQNSVSQRKKAHSVLKSAVKLRSACKAKATMVSDSTVHIVHCTGVKVIKRSNNFSQDSQESVLSESEVRSTATECGIDLPQHSIGKESQTISEGKESDLRMLLAKHQRSSKLMKGNEDLFDSISSHDSFFDIEGNVSLPQEAIECNPSAPSSDSLVFSSGEISKLSDKIPSSKESDVTPLPPRLVLETPLDSLPENSVSSAETFNSSSEKDNVDAGVSEVLSMQDDSVENASVESRVVEIAEDSLVFDSVVTMAEERVNENINQIGGEMKSSQSIDPSSENDETFKSVNDKPKEMADDFHRISNELPTERLGYDSQKELVSEEKSLKSSPPVVNATAEDQKQSSLDNEISLSQFDDDMEVPEQPAVSIKSDCIPASLSDTCSQMSVKMSAPVPPDDKPSSGSASGDTISTPASDSDILSTPARGTSAPNFKSSKSGSSPSRGQLLLKMSSRSSQIFAKAMSTKSANSSPTIGMNHVDTMPATPRSSKLNVEALELDCTPIYSPTTGSILKRRHVGSPSGSSSKKVKFRLPEAPFASESMKKMQRKSSASDDNILAIYSIKPSPGDKPVQTEQLTSQPQVTQTPLSQQTVNGEMNESQSQATPIASEYTESKVCIDRMVTHLTTPLWHETLRQCLISQGITTVGALAMLPEADVQLLPIAPPKLSTTLRAFKKSGATKNQPKCKATGSAAKLSREQIESILKLVGDGQLSDSQLGSEIRSLFASENKEPDELPR
ncbi:uncharacterized protein [Watersipora subatra]|uniref:uncharacterized protein n=1 Tax=Watersipora subatra TaxID=2589382 RepID=UPI00355BC785